MRAQLIGFGDCNRRYAILTENIAQLLLQAASPHRDNARLNVAQNAPIRRSKIVEARFQLAQIDGGVYARLLDVRVDCGCNLIRVSVALELKVGILTLHKLDCILVVERVLLVEVSKPQQAAHKPVNFEMRALMRRAKCAIAKEAVDERGEKRALSSAREQMKRLLKSVFDDCNRYSALAAHRL